MGDTQIVLDALTVTLVEYVKGDAVGEILAYASMLPHALVFFTVGVLAATKSRHVLIFVAGVVMNEALNAALKNWIKEPRIVVTEAYRLRHITVYGMPSNHAQFMAFYAVLAGLSLYRFLIETLRVRRACVLGLGLSALITSVSRVYLYYHSARQVYYGLLIGGTAAVIYHYLWILCARPPPRRNPKTRGPDLKLVSACR